MENIAYKMIEYIHENPSALQRTLDDNETRIQQIAALVNEKGLNRVVIFGIGSSYAAAMIAAPLFRCHSALTTHILPATEVDIYGRRILDDHTLVIVVSRTGERDWVVNALKKSISYGAYGVGMTGVPDSLLAQVSQKTLVTGEGPESSFPKTKSVIACSGLLCRLALALSEDDEETQTRLNFLRTLPDMIERVTRSVEPEIQNLVGSVQEQEPVVIVGTGSNYGAAMEGVIKIQETAVVTAHSDDTGNLLHGPLGAYNKKWLLIALVNSIDQELSRQLLITVGRFGAKRLSIVDQGVDLADCSDYVLTLPVRADPLLAGLISLPPIQLLNYYWTLKRGLNPDRPDASRTILDAILPPGREEPYF